MGRRGYNERDKEVSHESAVLSGGAAAAARRSADGAWESAVAGDRGVPRPDAAGDRGGGDLHRKARTGAAPGAAGVVPMGGAGGVCPARMEQPTGVVAVAGQRRLVARRAYRGE